MPTLRAIIFSILALFIFQGAYGQPGNPQTKKFSVFEKLNYPVYETDDSLTIAPNPNVSIEEHYGYPPGAYPVRAACTINNKTPLQLCKATMQDDTLVIRIVDKSPNSYYELKVSIAGKSFNTLYSFSYPETAERYEVFPTDQLLVLNRNSFVSGEEIRGFINFRGTGHTQPENHSEWNSKDDYVPSDYVIRGPFRAVIQ